MQDNFSDKPFRYTVLVSHLLPMPVMHSSQVAATSSALAALQCLYMYSLSIVCAYRHPPVPVRIGLMHEHI